MSDVIESLRDRDVYRWSYRDPNTDDRRWGSYHCCSRIAVVRDGRLCDTYWTGSDNRSFSPADLPKLELKRLGNLDELEVHMEYHADYYDDADIVDLNHANATRGNFYIRKGAVRSQAKMLDTARKNLERCKEAERSAVRRSEELCETIARIEAGDLNLHIASPPRS